MKKMIIVCMMAGLFALLTVKSVSACSCADFDIDEFLEDEERLFFYGVVEKEISNKRAIFHVKENYSLSPMDGYITLYTTTTIGVSCGYSFDGTEGQEMLVTGWLKDGEVRIGLCSIREGQSGSYNRITLNDEFQDTINLSTIRDHIELSQENKAYGVINQNSYEELLRQEKLRRLVPYGIGIGIIGMGLATFVVVKVSKSRKKCRNEVE